MHDGRPSSQIGADMGAGILPEFKKNSWGYQQGAQGRVKRPAVVIDAWGRAEWIDRGGCSPGTRVTQTIGVGPGKTCSRRGANHRDGIISPRAREGNHHRDIRATYGSAGGDRNIRSITAFALRQII